MKALCADAFETCPRYLASIKYSKSNKLHRILLWYLGVYSPKMNSCGGDGPNILAKFFPLAWIAACQPVHILYYKLLAHSPVISFQQIYRLSHPVNYSYWLEALVCGQANYRQYITCIFVNKLTDTQIRTTSDRPNLNWPNPILPMHATCQLWHHVSFHHFAELAG